MKKSIDEIGAYADYVPSFLVPVIEKLSRRIPAVNKRLENEYKGLLNDIGEELHPYSENHKNWAQLPEEGIEREEILSEMAALQDNEKDKWQKGGASGAVYHGDEEHIDFLNKVYSVHSQVNPLHADLWPSAIKYEAEIVSMTAEMLNAGQAGTESALGLGHEICGTVSSGGSESIMLAMKSYRDWARDKKGIKHPEMIIPVTAHAAFDKSAQYFGIKKRVVGLDDDYKADIKQVKKAINRHTAVIIASTPGFPHGIIDPVEEISELAWEKGIGCHVDACLGGFVLPWAEKLGYPVPSFDFRLRGVTSISADTHKYGYAAKGTSVILYRGEKLRHYQYYSIADWPGGLYMSPTFAGSRPGALSAACRAAMLNLGEKGYTEAVEKILKASDYIKRELRKIADLQIIGDPLWVIAMKSDTLNIYQILEEMTKKGWSLNGLHHPSALHIALTLRHTKKGVAEKFIADLRNAVDYVKEHPEDKGKMAPVYGLAAGLPFKGLISDLLKHYLDLFYQVPGKTSSDVGHQSSEN